MIVDVNYKPKVRDDIYYSDIYMNGEDGYWIIGSKENDSQLIIKNNKINVFKRLFNIMDGKNSIKDIEDMGFADSNELIKIVKSIANKGLLEGCDNKEQFNEVERFSLKIWRHDFRDYSEKIQNICGYLTNIFKGLSILIIIFSLYIISQKYYLLKDITIVKAIQFSDNSFMSTIIGYLLINMGTYILFFFHEGAHAVVAIKNKIRPHYVAFVLYLGFLPMCYVKIKNIYTLKRKDMYAVLLAGVKMNLILGLIFMDFYLLSENNLCKLFSISNFKMFYMNLIPLSLTDGYFVFGLLFRTPNTRMNFYKILASPKLIFSYSKKMVTLFIINFIVILLTLNFEIYVLFDILGISKSYIILKFIIIDVIYIYIFHFMNKVKFKKSRV